MHTPSDVQGNVSRRRRKDNYDDNRMVVYLDRETYTSLQRLSEQQNRSQSSVLRTVIKHGMRDMAGAA